MQKAGQSLTEIKNQILAKITSNQNIIKSLIIEDEDFLNTTPTQEQEIILNDPDLLIRKQIMLTKNITAKTNKDMPYITSAFGKFKKHSYNYQSGLIYFYVVIPNSWERTNYGIRYDFICDELDNTFSSIGIGKFEFYERGDMSVNENNLGHYISFDILDFGRW